MKGEPTIIQGGMGAGVSSWRLARAVSRLGQLGVVSGIALDQMLARRLQDGDPGGHMRRALDRFPFRDIAERIWQTYFLLGGKPRSRPYKRLPMQARENPRELQELCLVGNFVEVFLAREGHGNPVGVNYLEKIQIPHLPSLYGAMLAGAEYVLMGAGVPFRIPGVLDRFAHHQPATYPLHVVGANGDDDTMMSFSPRDFMDRELPPLRRPKFLVVVSSNTLATAMMKKANGKVDGLIVEGPTAGGHNAPPRGKLRFDANGEPVYGARDEVDLDQIRELNVPFWLAGGYGSPEKVRQARMAGAVGVQVGTAFAFCAESGFRDDYKRAVLRKIAAGEARVLTDMLASPTGFPFKVVQLEDTISEPEIYAARPRICDLGYLREAFKTERGTIDYRCAAEPVNVYVSKGGKAEDTVGKKCVCNALLASIDLPQARKGKRIEKGLVTSGNDLESIVRFIPKDGSTYTAADVVRTLLSG